jgi:chromosomal replication initiation ATPase DnaA
MENSAAVAPQVLERAINTHLAEIPDDGPVLERLYAYLERFRPFVTDIREAVAEFYAVHPFDLIGRSREYEVAHARQVFCFLCYRHTRLSMNQIAGHAGLNNHTTVSHAVRKIEKLSISRPRMADDLDLLRLRISEKMLLRARGSC